VAPSSARLEPMKHKKDLKPQKDTKKKMRPITPSAFHDLLKKAATTVQPVPKHAPKSA